MTDATGGTQAHAGAGHGTADHLVKMANDIGHFFRAEPQREDAIAGISNHIARYWTKRMREKIAAHMQHGGELVSPDKIEFKDLSKLHIIGIYPSYKAAHAAWRATAKT